MEAARAVPWSESTAEMKVASAYMIGGMAGRDQSSCKKALAHLP